MKKHLAKKPIHLGLEGTAIIESQISGMAWYGAYLKRRKKDGKEGRLISMYSFDESLKSWEMHPHGHEVVICIEGQMEVIQETKSKRTKTLLKAGEYLINKPGVWHTANVKTRATAIFITAGEGTEHRPRASLLSHNQKTAT